MKTKEELLKSQQELTEKWHKLYDQFQSISEEKEKVEQQLYDLDHAIKDYDKYLTEHKKREFNQQLWELLIGVKLETLSATNHGYLDGIIIPDLDVFTFKENKLPKADKDVIFQLLREHQITGLYINSYFQPAGLWGDDVIQLRFL